MLDAAICAHSLHDSSTDTVQAKAHNYGLETVVHTVNMLLDIFAPMVTAFSVFLVHIRVLKTFERIIEVPVLGQNWPQLCAIQVCDVLGSQDICVARC
jgi:hypothetical protein